MYDIGFPLWIWIWYADVKHIPLGYKSRVKGVVCKNEQKGDG